MVDGMVGAMDNILMVLTIDHCSSMQKLRSGEGIKKGAGGGDGCRICRG